LLIVTRELGPQHNKTAIELLGRICPSTWRAGAGENYIYMCPHKFTLRFNSIDLIIFPWTKHNQGKMIISIEELIENHNIYLSYN